MFKSSSGQLYLFDFLLRDRRYFTVDVTLGNKYRAIMHQDNAPIKPPKHTKLFQIIISHFKEVKFHHVATKNSTEEAT